ncbi:MAG TPA: VOC family protein [Bacilli bacterium]|nr:VOC family protein [Bacilli bacterium]
MAKIKWDHVVHYVNDLTAAKDVFVSNGLIAFEGGSHKQWGTYNVLSYFGLTYLEFLALENRKLAESISDPNDVVKDAVKHLPEEEVLSRLALRTDDIEAVRERLVTQGIEATPIMAGKRNDAKGNLIEWKMMTIPGDYQGLPYPFVIQWNGLDEEREAQLKETGIIQEHPAGNVVMERAIFHVEQPQAVAEHWAEIFDLSIDTEMADKAIAVKTDKHAFVFQLGSENRLQVIEFSTDNEQLKGKNIKIGDGIYSFR